MQKEYLLPGSILIAGVIVAGAVIYSTGLKNPAAADAPIQNQDTKPKVTFKLTKDDVILGDPNAPVTVMEYADFQCPFCGHFYSQSEGKIKENFVASGKVKMVYRHFAFLGPESLAAAEAAECAKDQGKFWEFHDALYDAEVRDGQERNGNLNQTLFSSIGTRLGMDVTALTACIQQNKYANKVQADYTNAVGLGVESTPTIFVNGKKIEGALPYEQFEAAINLALSKK